MVGFLEFMPDIALALSSFDIPPFFGGIMEQWPTKVYLLVVGAEVAVHLYLQLSLRSLNLVHPPHSPTHPHRQRHTNALP